MSYIIKSFLLYNTNNNTNEQKGAIIQKFDKFSKVLNHHFRMTVMEEMCNYYIYYYAPYEKFEPLYMCSNPANEKLFEKYPSETEAAAGSSAEMDMQSFCKILLSWTMNCRALAKTS